MIMKRVIKFILFLFYRYYDQGSTKEIAYEKSIFSMMLLLFINIFTLLIILNKTDIMPYNASDPRWLQYLKTISIFVLPGFILISIIFRKKEIINLKYDEDKIDKGNTILIMYIALSFIAITIAALTA